MDTAPTFEKIKKIIFVDCFLLSEHGSIIVVALVIELSGFPGFLLRYLLANTSPYTDAAIRTPSRRWNETLITISLSIEILLTLDVHETIKCNACGN